MKQKSGKLLLLGGYEISKQRKYVGFFSEGQERIASFEMFLWYKIGLKRTKEERRLLQMVWKRFLGYDNIKSLKRLKELAEKKIIELEVEYKRARRKAKYNVDLTERYIKERKAIRKKHFSKTKQENILRLIDAKKR